MSEIYVLSKTELDDAIRRAARLVAFDLREELKTPQTPEVMTKTELAEYLRCDVQKITRYMKKGMPFVTFGEQPRFYKTEIDAWLKAN